MTARSTWSLLRTYIVLVQTLMIYICSGQESAELVDEGCPFEKQKRNPESLIGGIIAIYIICLICAIIIIVYLVKFYQNRDDPNVENRHPRLVYCTVSMVIFMNIVLFPLAIDYWTLECVTHTPWLRKDTFIKNGGSWIEGFLFIAFVVLLLAWLILVVLRYDIYIYIYCE